VIRERQDSSDSDSGFESAVSSPIEMTNQSPDFQLTPTESVATDLEANIHSPSPPFSLSEASQIAPEESRPQPVDSGTAAQPVCSYSVCEEGEASAAELGIVASSPSSLTQVPRYEEGSGSSFFPEPVDSSSPLVEVNYTRCESDTPSPKPTKSVHFATPLVTEVISFPTSTCEENMPQAANAALPATAKTVGSCTPLMAEATLPACEQNNVFLTSESFETDSIPPLHSNLATLPANVSRYGESTPQASDASLAFADPESGLPPLMKDQALPVHPPPPSNLATLPINIQSRRGESSTEVSNVSIAFADPESGLPPLKEAANSYSPLLSPVHPPLPSSLVTLPANIPYYGESTPVPSDASLAFADPESGLPPLMEAANSYSPLPSTANAVREESNRWTPDAVFAGAVDFSPLPYSQSGCASQWTAENGANAEVAPTGSVNSLPSLLGDDHIEHERHNIVIMENTHSSVTATTAQGAPNEPPVHVHVHVAQAAQQESSCSYDNNNDLDDAYDCDSDEEDEEQERIATLFMNFCYCDENKEQEEKSTSRKKKAPLVAAEAITAPAKNKSLTTDIAINFDSPPSLPLTNTTTTTTYPARLPGEQNCFNYTTTQALPPPPTQISYVASAASGEGTVLNLESIYTDSLPPATDNTYTAYPRAGYSPGQRNYTTAQALPSPLTQTAYVVSAASIDMTVNMYTDSLLPTTDKTRTAHKDKPVLFVPDDGDLHVHEYARRKEERYRTSDPLRRAVKAQSSRSTFSFTAFTVSLG
jgi:hypothetical protein